MNLAPERTRKGLQTVDSYACVSVVKAGEGIDILMHRAMSPPEAYKTALRVNFDLQVSKEVVPVAGLECNVTLQPVPAVTEFRIAEKHFGSKMGRKIYLSRGWNRQDFGNYCISLSRNLSRRRAAYPHSFGTGTTLLDQWSD